MSRVIWGTLLAGMLMSGVAAFHRPAEAAEPSVRIGIYDNRAVAVAYAASKYNPVGEKMKEYKRAQEAEDAERAKQLEQWGAKHQRQLHRQGFGRVPVDDLLAHVKDRLSEVARQENVTAIVWQCDFAGPGVTTVDVTDQLVSLFEPSEKTLKTVQQLKKQKPIELDVIEQNHDH